MPPRHPSSLVAIARACAGCALLACTHAAFAQVSGSLSVDSDYRFRGVSVGGGRPSARLEANYDADHGWYGGGSIASAQDSDGERYSQVVAYGGRVMPLTGSLNADMGVSLWHFSTSGIDFAEAYAGVIARDWSVRLNYSPDYFRQHLKTLYVDANAHYLLTDTWRLFVHAGALVRLSSPQAVEYADYDYGYGYDHGSAAVPRRTRWDMRAGVGWNLTDTLDVQVAWNRASRSGPIAVNDDGWRGGWVATATWSF